MTKYWNHSSTAKKTLRCALLASVMTLPAHAQDSAENNDTAETQGFTRLDEIVVTAQRKAESLQDAAIPINAATGADLARVGVLDSTSLNKIAPALYTTSGGGANAGYFIRGVGNFTNNGYTNPAVAFNIDGVYIGRPSSTISSFLDVAVVEVLKGPQGTLYGRNATGGAINVIPTKPILGENSGYVTGSYGNYEAYNIEGAANIAIGDKSAFRVAATYNDHDGYNSDGTNDAKDFAIRGQFYSELSDIFNFRLSVDYSTQKGVGPGTTVVGYYQFASPAVPGRNDFPVAGWSYNAAPESVSAPHTGLHSPQSLEYTGNVASAPLFAPFDDFVYPSRDDSYFGTNAEFNIALGEVDMVVIPAFRRSKLDNQFNGPPFKSAINKDTADQYSVEVRFSGSTGPIDWIAGGFYFDEKVVGQNAFNQFGTVSHNAYDSRSDSTAVFSRVTYNISEKLRLVGGIRYTDENRSIDATATASAGVCLEEPVGRAPSCPQVPTLPNSLTLEDMFDALDPGLFLARPLSTYDPNGAAGVAQVFPYGPFIGPGGSPGAILAITPNTIQESSGDSQVTFRAAVEYDITPENLIYASFENGFRAGGFNLARGREEYEPEFIDAYTLGSKNRFFDDRLELNIELFYWKYKGQQLAALGLDIDGNNAFYTRNVGESTIKGVDIDFRYLLTETTRIRGGVQYLDAVYDKYNYNQVDVSDETDPPNFLRPVTGCTATQVMEPTRSFDVDCSGKQALNSPKWTVTMGVEQTVELGSVKLVGTLDGRYRGSREVGFNYIPASHIGGDFTMDAAVTLGDLDNRWQLTAFIRNLTDKAVPSTVQVGSGNIVGTVYETPRTYGLRATKNF